MNIVTIILLLISTWIGAGGISELRRRYKVKKLYNKGKCPRCGKPLHKRNSNETEKTIFDCYRCDYKVLVTYKIDKVEEL